MKWFPFNFSTNVGCPGESLGGFCSDSDPETYIARISLDSDFGVITAETMSEAQIDKLISDIKDYIIAEYPTNKSQQEYYSFVIEKIKLNDEFYLNVISGEDDVENLETFFEGSGYSYLFYGACDSDYEPIEALFEYKEDNKKLELLYEKFKEWLNVHVTIPAGNPQTWPDSDDYSMKYAKYFTIHEWS